MLMLNKKIASNQNDLFFMLNNLLLKLIKLLTVNSFVKNRLPCTFQHSSCFKFASEQSALRNTPDYQ
jgi:hypothetical protein